jgi:hypothetical protein
VDGSSVVGTKVRGFAYALTICLAVAPLPLPGQTMGPSQAPPASSAPDRSIHVSLDNVVIDEAAVRTLFGGIYAAAESGTPSQTATELMQGRETWHVERIETVEKDQDQMPHGYRYFFYAGRDKDTGREILWEARPGKDEGDEDERGDEYVAAYALAALDAGYVGEPWKTLYNGEANATARLTFGKAIARALDEASDQKKAVEAADVAWIREHIVAGTSRANAYALLRSYGLVAYNSAYNPGVPITRDGAKGCDFTDQSASAWPYHGEPLPTPSGECAFFRKDPGAFPSAYITLDGAFTIACGSQVAIAIAFDDSDRIRSVHISDPQWSCV